jgi:hypothetical protein
MNIDEAIQAHAAWKVKLSTYLGKKDGSLKAAEAAPITVARSVSGCTVRFFDD